MRTEEKAIREPLAVFFASLELYEDEEPSIFVSDLLYVVSPITAEELWGCYPDILLRPQEDIERGNRKVKRHALVRLPTGRRITHYAASGLLISGGRVVGPFETLITLPSDVEAITNHIGFETALDQIEDDYPNSGFTLLNLTPLESICDDQEDHAKIIFVSAMLEMTEGRVRFISHIYRFAQEASIQEIYPKLPGIVRNNIDEEARVRCKKVHILEVTPLRADGRVSRLHVWGIYTRDGVYTDFFSRELAFRPDQTLLNNNDFLEVVAMLEAGDGFASDCKVVILNIKVLE